MRKRWKTILLTLIHLLLVCRGGWCMNWNKLAIRGGQRFICMNYGWRTSGHLDMFLTSRCHVISTICKRRFNSERQIIPRNTSKSVIKKLFVKFVYIFVSSGFEINAHVQYNNVFSSVAWNQNYPGSRREETAVLLITSCLPYRFELPSQSSTHI